MEVSQDEAASQDDGSLTRIQQLEEEKKKMQDEFNVQRGKLMSMFKQKEAELEGRSKENKELHDKVARLQVALDDLKSQLVVRDMTLENSVEHEKRKANEEIASLQRLVHETVEESSANRSQYDYQLHDLKMYNSRLEQEIEALKQERQQPKSPHHQEQSGLAPSQMLNALTKGIVKKLGADAFSSPESGGDDSVHKENADVLLVAQLEDQIQALKEKLRAADQQLQRCQECGHTHHGAPTLQDSASSTPPPTAATEPSGGESDVTKMPSCAMCSNYEADLVKEQARTTEFEAKMRVAEKAAERHKEDLLKEIGFRKEMEEKWNEKKEEHRQQVGELRTAVECAEKDLREMRQDFKTTGTEMRQLLGKLTADRKRIQEELLSLQKENDNLIGKYSIHSAALQSEAINLPDNVEELQELVLKHHQELIIAKVGKENAEEKINNLQSEMRVLRDQIANDQHERKSLENSLVLEINTLKTEKVQLERQLEDTTGELRMKISSLQHELANNEAVSKDFVRLSQSLQMQLEKIRETDVQVRWQHEEDVSECPVCKENLEGVRRKDHCRHCGQIYCHKCLSKTVPSGPSMRPSKVCAVCHTLLDKSSAPYFSETPPPVT